MFRESSLFASLAADYPREPRAGEPDLLGDADRRLAAGEITHDEHLEIVHEFARIVLAEQEASGLAMLTDGDLADEDRLRRLVDGLGGTSSDRAVALPDGAEVRAPRFDRAPAWREPITLDAWRWADAASDIMVKQVLIGPYTIARLADPGGASREVLAVFPWPPQRRPTYQMRATTQARETPTAASRFVRVMGWVPRGNGET